MPIRHRHQAARRDAGRRAHAAGRVLHRSGATSSARWTRCSDGCGSAPGATEQIERPGQFFVRELLGESIIVTRDAVGDACSAFHNVCRHRGTRLCTEATGAFAGSIQCPYHAWTYDLDGRLIGAPHMDEVPHFRKEDYPLHRVARRRVGRPHLPQPRAGSRRRCATQLADLPAKFAPWRMQDLRLGHRIVYDVQGELEADHPELQRVPALPEPASGAEQALALSQRRERAAAARPTWAGGWICGPASTTLSMDGTCPRAIPAGALEPTIGGASTTTRSSRTCCSACTPTT